MNLKDICSPIRQDMEEFEERMRDIVDSDVYPVLESYNHIFSSGGKRIRPALVLLSAKCLGHASNISMDAACTVELIHTASLIHDDIIDSAEIRRGKPAIHELWGTEIAVAVGDYLFSRAMEILTAHGNCEPVKILSKAVKDMAEGELLETVNRRNFNLTEEEYIKIISGKTAALMSASCKLTAEIASAPIPYSDALSQFGLNFGISYQIVDDLLDIASTNDQIGKPVKNSIREGNFSLPIIYALRNAGNKAKSKLLSILSREEISDVEVDEAIEIISNLDSNLYTKAIAGKYMDNAKDAISILEDSSAKQALLDIADFVILNSNHKLVSSTT